MQGVPGAFKIEKRFWSEMSNGCPDSILADQWCMNRISGILNTRTGVLKRNEWDNTLLLNQIDEIDKALTNIKQKIAHGGIPTIRVVLD